MIVGLLWGRVVNAQNQKKQSPFDESVWRVEHLHNQKKIIQSY